MKHLIRPSLLLMALAVAPVSSAAADTITGRVVDQSGVGVANVDIDVKNVGSGGDPTIVNAGTDLNGFFATTLPAGIYRVTFSPPAPPTTTHLIVEVEPVIVVGTTPMGVISLPAGVSLGGHIQNGSGFPVAGVNIDVIEKATGDSINLVGDFTDVFGNFVIAAPTGAIELRLDATPVFGATLVSNALDLTLTSNTTIDDVTLLPGLTVSGVVRDPSGSGVENADIDVFVSATGAKIYTPRDDTDAAGNFSVVVPAGIWDVEICPSFDDLLVATDAEGVVVAAPTNLGVFVVENGVVLSGTVRDFNGAAVLNADVDVFVTATGASIVTCGDQTSSTGSYAVVVPLGTLDVRFDPVDYTLGLARDFHGGVTIAADATINGVLPSCPLAANYGLGLAGTGGLIPRITSSGGAPSGGNKNWSIELRDGLPGSNAILVLSLGAVSVPRFGGTLLVSLAAGLAFPFTLVLDGSGAATFGPISLEGAAGFTGYAQFVVRDPAAPSKWAMSEGLSIGFCN